jgi:hypothetical protein
VSGWWLNTNRDLSAQIKYMMMVPLAGTGSPSPCASHRIKSILFPDTWHARCLCLSPFVRLNRKRSVGLNVGLMWAN